jgi:cytochrome c biogenesis protein CcmG, thiol:disulfide interchange protein DsbE
MGGEHEMSTQPGQPGAPAGLTPGPATAPGEGQAGTAATEGQAGTAGEGQAGTAAAEAPAGTAAGEGQAPPRGRRMTGRLRATGPAKLAAAVAIAAAAVTAISLIGASSSAKPGGPAPVPAKPFTLGVLGHPARHLSLASLAGQPVIVNFFASWCAPCKKETPLIASFYRSTHGHPTIIGIDVNDSTSAALAFVHRMGVRYPLAADPLPMKVATAWNLPGLPATFFLDSGHKIVKRVFGPVTRQDLTTGTALADGRAG